GLDLSRLATTLNRLERSYQIGVNKWYQSLLRNSELKWVSRRRLLISSSRLPYFLPIFFKPNLSIDDLLEHADVDVQEPKEYEIELLEYMDVHDNDASESSQPSWEVGYSTSLAWLVPSCCVIFDLGLEPLSLSFDFVFTSEIFKSLSFSLDRLCHLAILCLDKHAHTLHHLESLLTISLDRLDILKEDLVYQSLRKSLSLILKLS
ncbi:hypothetical protein Tco_1413716, partial [Tanacetum coccineum]